MEFGSVRGSKRDRRFSSIGAVILGGAALLVGGMALGMPDIALQASLRGVKVWWEVLFPALFPFFVLSEVLLGFGVVHLFGTLLDPLMRPLFRLPGAGGFVVAMGFASGYPVGARLTSRLMEQNMLNRAQGERLVEMTTTSDPIFLIGAVCIGFFGRPDAVPLLAAAHYGGAMLLGVLGRWRRDPEREPEVGPAGKTGEGEPEPAAKRLKAALAAMHRARLADGRPFGVLLQQAMLSSLQLMVIVGGLVVFFSAALDLLLHSGLLEAVRRIIEWGLHATGMPAALSHSFVQGAFEVTLGARAAALASQGAAPLPLVDRLAAAAFVLSWAGLSVHAQVAGLMGKTGWRYGRFARTRLLHGALAAGVVYLIWPFAAISESVFAPLTPGSRDARAGFPLAWCLWPLAAAIMTLAFLIAAGLAALFVRRILHKQRPS